MMVFYNVAQRDFVLEHFHSFERVSFLFAICLLFLSVHCLLVFVQLQPQVVDFESYCMFFNISLGGTTLLCSLIAYAQNYGFDGRIPARDRASELRAASPDDPHAGKAYSFKLITTVLDICQ